MLGLEKDLGQHLFLIWDSLPIYQLSRIGFPTKMIFGNIRGHAFIDVGAAWDNISEFSTRTGPQGMEVVIWVIIHP